MLARMWRKVNPCSLLVRMYIGTATMESSMEVSQKIKIKIELLYDPAIPVLGIHPKDMKLGSQRDICTPVFVAALFTIAKI